MCKRDCGGKSQGGARLEVVQPPSPPLSSLGAGTRQASCSAAASGRGDRRHAGRRSPEADKLRRRGERLGEHRIAGQRRPGDWRGLR